MDCHQGPAREGVEMIKIITLIVVQAAVSFLDDFIMFLSLSKSNISLFSKINLGDLQVCLEAGLDSLLMEEGAALKFREEIKVNNMDWFNPVALAGSKMKGIVNNFLKTLSILEIK